MNIPEIKQKIRTYLQSRGSQKVILVLGCGVIALAIFQAGILVGTHEAKFGKDWNNNYYDNFGPRHDDGMPRPNREFPNAHGAAGKILKINLPTITVEDRDMTEKVVLLNNSTKVVRQRQPIQAKDLAIDDFIVVIGNPNDQGQIEAKFIRTMPVPPPAPATDSR